MGQPGHITTQCQVIMPCQAVFAVIEDAQEFMAASLFCADLQHGLVWHNDRESHIYICTASASKRWGRLCAGCKSTVLPPSLNVSST